MDEMTGDLEEYGRQVERRERLSPEEEAYFENLTRQIAEQDWKAGERW